MRLSRIGLWCALLTQFGWAWDPRGHRVVLEVAWNYLSAPVQEWVEQTVKAHPDPRVEALQDAVMWPDWIRAERPQSRGWHFINRPLEDDGSFVPVPDNVVLALDLVQRQVVECVDPAGRAEALAFLLHFVGDIHQPLHACNYVGPGFPDGDRGGSRQPLRDCSWAQNLHRLWDTAGYPPEVRVEQLSRLCLATVVGPEAHQLDFQLWAQESWEQARRVAYPGLQPPSHFSPAYQEAVQRCCRQRLHSAGLRLAYLLEKMGPEGQRYSR